MAEESVEKNHNVSRRHFMRDAASMATITCLSPGLLAGCQAGPPQASISSEGDVMDEALEMMAGLAQLTNHGPMAAEALVALGRRDSVMPFVEAYRKRFSDPYPEARQTITQQNWHEALGDARRAADWTGFFRHELNEASWSQVLERWTAILAPGASAAAGHGLIRTGHAVRSLSVRETNWRLHELAEGLGYWAAYYQSLPEDTGSKAQRFSPSDAIGRIPVLPAQNRTNERSIMIGLRDVNNYSLFAGAADLIDTKGDTNRLLSQVTEAFARAYVSNATPRSFVALIHTVTGTTAVRSLLPHLSAATAARLLRYGWQMAAALYSMSSTGSTNAVAAKEVNRDELIDRAVSLKEEHAIKFTEACLREAKLNPKPIYLLAASDALSRIRRP